MQKDELFTLCAECGTKIEVFLRAGGLDRAICEICAAKDDNRKRGNQGIGASRARWDALTKNFAALRNTDFHKLPCPEQTARALRWEYGARGLNLWGAARTGKTRTMLLVLEALYLEHGKKVRVFGPGDFAQECTKHGWAAANWVAGLKNLDALAFDDIGKLRLSPVIEGHWFSVLDYFCASGKPVLLTHNFDGTNLAKQFKAGEAILGRIREHCEAIHFGGV